MPRIHIAIMRRSWGLTKKILSGEKTVETRWYMNKYKPWDQVSKGDIIYFKDSGGPVTVKAKVSGVKQYTNLDEKGREKIFNKYSQQDLGVSEVMSEIKAYIKNKRYCIIIHLKSPKKVTPFNINKDGYGAMASWLIVDDIRED
ncbi:MAG: hypothetical protein PHX72_00260 [Candidatus Shapirobacteria bacterium]|nr:hypothetical protein [Candidatus Shapirobacteria bacterium]